MLAGGYLGWHYNQGWIAHDEGLLGHTAELTMEGQTPHIEFQDVYTGLLSHINAVCFKVLGINLAALRVPLLIGATLTSIVWYLIALRFVSPMHAGIVSVTSTVWSFPNYFAALPSWYILMTASWTIWALIKFHETTSRKYILLAGIFSGVAILFKIVGLYLVAASLFALWINHSESTQPESKIPKKQTSATATAPHLFISLGLAGTFILLVGLLIRQHLSFSTAVYFLIPVAASMATMLEISKKTRLDLKKTIINCLLFGGAVGLPLLAFVSPYLLNGHIEDLMHGLFELPQARLEQAAALPPNGLWCLVAIPIVGLTIVESKIPKSITLPLTATVAFCGATLCLLASNSFIYQLAFFSVQYALPAIGIGVWYATRKHEIAMPAVILSLVTACLFLTQYPYSTGLYFCYCAPLIILTFTGLIGRRVTCNQPLWLTLMIMLGAFAVGYLNYSNPRLIGSWSQRIENDKSLQTTRSQLQIEGPLQREYNALLQIVEEQTESGDFILAGPDCPQFYFLTGRRNPTRQCYDLFRAYQLGSQSALEDEIKTLLREKDIRLFVQNRVPEFSPRYSEEFVIWLESWGNRSPIVGSGRFEIFVKKKL